MIDVTKDNVMIDLVYDADERKYFEFVSRRLVKASKNRSKPYREFNDMDYNTRYDSNQDNFLAYTRKRRNEEERSIVTGTVRNKGKSLLAALLGYNLSPNFIAFDDNNEVIDELGGLMDDLVKKADEIDEYDKKRPLIYTEALAQGTWFTEEVFLEQINLVKKLKGELDVKKLKATKWETKEIKKPGVCATRLIPGKRVYLGNIREYFLDRQPYAFTVEIMDYHEAATIFNEWERWQYVPTKILHFDKQSEDDNKTDTDGVEVVKYYDPIMNEFQIFCNNIMMLPIKFPLSVVSPSGKIPLAKGDLDPTKWEFAYSKSFTDDCMFDQVLLDDFIRTLVLKAQQGLMPPMINNSNKILGRRIFLPGMITSNVNPNLVQPLLKENGVSTADVSMFEIIKGIVDEKSVSPQFSGSQTKGKQSATEILELKKQQMMKLGLTIWGIIEFEKSRSMLKLYDILANWTKPTDQKIDKLKKKMVDVYQTFTIESEDQTGQPVDKMIEFSPEKANFPTDFIKREEDYLSQGRERPVRKVYVDPVWLRNLNANWFVTISPTEKDSSELNRTLFVRNMSEGVQLFGPQAFNMDYLKQRWAILNKEDPNKLFVKQQPMMPGQVPGQPPMPGNMGQQMTAGVTAGARQPAQQGAPQPSLTQLLGTKPYAAGA